MGESEVSEPIQAQTSTSTEKVVRKNPILEVARKATDVINKLPFSGKMSITPTVLNAAAEKNPYYKTVKTMEAIGLLGFMSLAHFTQGEMGRMALQRNLEKLSVSSDPETIFSCFVDVAYMTANYAVTYAQVYLAARVGEKYVKDVAKFSGKLNEWGIKKGEVDYDKVADKLVTAIENKDQSSIDTFFMLLPKSEKEKVLEEVKVIEPVLGEKCSAEEMTQKIAEIEQDVESKSRFGYIGDIVKNTHRKNFTGRPYTFKEQLKMVTVTLGGQLAFMLKGGYF